MSNEPSDKYLAQVQKNRDLFNPRDRRYFHAVQSENPIRKRFRSEEYTSIPNHQNFEGQLNDIQPISTRQIKRKSELSRHPSLCSNFASGYPIHAKELLINKISLDAVVPSPDGIQFLQIENKGRLIMIGAPEEVKVWDANSNALRSTLKESAIMARFVPGYEESQIVMACTSGDILFWDFLSDSTDCICSGLHVGGAYELAICYDDPNLLFSCGGDITYLIDRRQQHPAISFRSDSHHLSSVEVNPAKSKEICICGNDEFIRIYDVRKSLERRSDNILRRFSSRSKRELSVYNSVTYNYNGTEIVAQSTSDIISVFDLMTCKESTATVINSRSSEAKFYGLDSDFVICASLEHIHVLRKSSNKVVRKIKAPNTTLIQTNPTSQRFATCDNEFVKLWGPYNNLGVDDEDDDDDDDNKDGEDSEDGEDDQKKELEKIIIPEFEFFYPYWNTILEKIPRWITSSDNDIQENLSKIVSLRKSCDLIGRDFCQNFLVKGGIADLMFFIKKQDTKLEIDAKFLNECFAICLHLIKFHLCGNMDAIVINLSSPSSSYSLRSAISDKTLESTKEMTSDQIKSLINCFIVVAWTFATVVMDQAGSEDCLNSKISSASLEIFFECLRMNPTLIDLLYTLPCIDDFLIDILVTSPYQEVRSKVIEHFFELCAHYDCVDKDKHKIYADVSEYTVQMSQGVSEERSSKHRSPRQFVLKILTKARLPFWVPSAKIMSINYRLLKQSEQYFSLLSQLLSKLPMQSQLDTDKMLEDEIKWLDNFVCQEEHEPYSNYDNVLLAGHLWVVRTLLVCEGVDKTKYGSRIVCDTLYKSLFSAAKINYEDCVDSENILSDLTSKCSKLELRIAAYDLLMELASGNDDKMKRIYKELASIYDVAQNGKMEHTACQRRNPCGYVGLKNGGETCYMNSVIQQIFMTPGITEYILAIDDDQVSGDSILFQTQQVLRHLLDSKLQFYTPEDFWKILERLDKMYKITEPQDAVEFFEFLADQLDKQMSNLGKREIFNETCRGSYLHQEICHICKDRYEQEEPFFALNVTVKNATLQDSLEQLVKGEILDGVNAAFCDKCKVKTKTTMRKLVKVLPPLLCIQLNRIEHNWEANRAFKLDDHFKFPLVLDMEPYTAEGMSWREEQLQMEDGSDSDDLGNTSEDDSSSEYPSMEVESMEHDTFSQKRPLPRNMNTSFCCPSGHINYELVGVVVHIGQLNEGHKYSFIKERRNNLSKGKWFKFNDITVEEFEMNEANMESEWFGRKYKFTAPNGSDVERQRCWNAYLVFYEKVEDVKTPASAKKRKVSNTMPKTVSEKSTSLNQSLQSLINDIELQRLAGEADCKPSLEWLWNEFAVEVLSIELASKFLFGIYYQPNYENRVDTSKWERSMIQIIGQSEATCMWMVNYLANEGLDFIKPLLLDCPTKDIRSSVFKYIEKTMASFYEFGRVSSDKSFNIIIDYLLHLLSEDVSSNFSQSGEYFQVLFNYAILNVESSSHLISKGAFGKLIEFLIGNRVFQDFGLLHSILAILFLRCDVSKFQTHGSTLFYKSKIVDKIGVCIMSPDMIGDLRYSDEVVMALREVSNGVEYIVDMLCHCSFNNKNFSFNILNKIFLQCVTAPSNKLRHIFEALLQLLMLPDELQQERLIYIMEEVNDEKLHQKNGLLALIQQNHNISDSKRSYHFIKFLVNLSSSCILAKEYLLSVSNQWEWAVRWHDGKMSENCWSVQGNMSNEETVSHSFQRTISAQDTLAGATALLTKIDQQEYPDYKMDVSSSMNVSGCDNVEDHVATDSQEALRERGDYPKFVSEHLDLPSEDNLDDLF